MLQSQSALENKLHRRLAIGLPNGASVGIMKSQLASALALAAAFSEAWRACTSEVRITPQSKSWWNDECGALFTQYKASLTSDDWKAFRSEARWDLRHDVAHAIHARRCRIRRIHASPSHFPARDIRSFW